MSIPLTSTQNRKKRVPWWNKTCAEAIKNKNRLLTQYKRHPSHENLIQFKKSRAEARRIIRDNRKHSFRTFLSTISTSTPPAQMWAQIWRLSGKRAYEPISCLQDLDDPTQFHTTPNDFAVHQYNVTKNTTPNILCRQNKRPSSRTHILQQKNTTSQ